MIPGYFENEDLATEVVYDWVERTVKILGANMAKRGVKFSDPGSPNVRILIIDSLKGKISLHFYYRDALRFVDMGSGRGYTKGRRITQDDYRNAIRSRRARKPILNKPIYGRLNQLLEAVAGKIMFEAEIGFDDI